MRVSTRRTRCGHLHRLAAPVAAVIAIDAHAELVEIAWEEAGRLQTTVTVAPGKFAEVCGKLAQGQSIAWSFKGERPMNFNIRHHEASRSCFRRRRTLLSMRRGGLMSACARTAAGCGLTRPTCRRNSASCCGDSHPPGGARPYLGPASRVPQPRPQSGHRQATRWMHYAEHSANASMSGHWTRPFVTPQRSTKVFSALCSVRRSRMRCRMFAGLCCTMCPHRNA